MGLLQIIQEEMDFPGWAGGKQPTCHWIRKRCRFNSRVGKVPLEKGMATHSSILAWRIPWTEESGGLQAQSRVIQE